MGKPTASKMHHTYGIGYEKWKWSKGAHMRSFIRRRLRDLKAKRFSSDNDI